VAATFAVAAINASVPARASAAFNAPTLLSGTQQSEFGGAAAPAISEDGRYVAFQGSIGNISGVFERDLNTGEIRAVATSYAEKGALAAPSAELSAPDAAGPSVSADGQYVAFTTTADLNPAEEPSVDSSCPEVYVRNMDEPTASSSYTLAAAGVIFEPERGVTESPCRVSFAGAQAAPGVALSANGRSVVFTVLSPSNLEEGTTTPPSQVVLGNLEAHTTTLVSVTPEGHATPGGGAYPSAYSETEMPHQPIENGSNVSEAGAYEDQVTASSAAIDAQGNTVAWLGTNVNSQVPEASGSATEVEPLWRRVGSPSATTKRLLGAAGLDFSYFPNQLELDEPVRSGALVSTKNSTEFVPPVLSANGDTVAVLANAPPPAEVKSAELSSRSEAPASDAYVVHVEESTALPVVTPITTTPSYDAEPQAVGDVTDLAISPNGTHLAFETDRTQIVSPSLTLLSYPLPYTRTFQTYDANLALGTLQQVVGPVFDGPAPNGSGGLLSFSASGQTLAFSSNATDLFYGDAVANTEVYTVQEVASSEEVVSPLLPAPPAAVLPAPDWLLSVTADAQPNGEVLLDAQVPGAGRLGVSATAQLPRGTVAGVSRKRPHVSRHSAAAATSRSTKRPNRAPTVTLVSPLVSQAATLAGGPTELELHVHVKAPFDRLIARKTGLYAIVRVTFAAPGHPTLAQEVPVTFRRVVHARDKQAKRS
jgi:hypothetical protein